MKKIIQLFFVAILVFAMFKCAVKKESDEPTPTVVPESQYGNVMVVGAVVDGVNDIIYLSWTEFDEHGSPDPEHTTIILLSKSADGGLTWLNEDIAVTDFSFQWLYYVPGVQRSPGFPILNCDLSNGANRGTLYINWTDQRSGAEDTDVWLAKSTDGGMSWSEPRRVNDDPPGRHQFFSWMTVDLIN